MKKGNNPDNKVEKSIFISYKYGVKGYKPWNLITRKIVYSRDVIFREVESTSKVEDIPKEKEQEKKWLKNEVGSDLVEEEESSESHDEVEP
jgi:hypothetical protein